MGISLDIHWNTNRLAAVFDSLPNAIDFRRPPMRDAAQKAMAAVMRFEHGRFVSASGGDGTWKPLSKRTIQQRIRTMHKQSGARGKVASAANATVAILYATGSLERGLFETGFGHFQETTKSAVREGVRGGRHPTAPVSVGQLAAIHHFGSGRIPARPVMGPVDAGTLNYVGQALAEGVGAAFAQLASFAGGQPAQVA